MTIAEMIPEWPKINGSRGAIIGMKGGADHPFGALLVVTTPFGLVVVDEYLERQQANIKHKNAIVRQFETAKFTDLKWAVNDTEKELRLEFSLAGIATYGVPNARSFGIQRVQSWLNANQLFFVATRCPQALEQLKKYRYAENIMPDGQKRLTETVFRADDELPEALGVAMLAWPELPKIDQPTMTERERKRWEALPEDSRQDILRMKEYTSQTQSRDLDENDPTFPVGDFFGHTDGSSTKLW